jgi:hypothetical protein
VEELLRQAGARSIVALTSTITITEVVHGTEEKLHRALDDKTERRVDELWAPGRAGHDDRGLATSADRRPRTDPGQPRRPR